MLSVFRMILLLTSSAILLSRTQNQRASGLPITTGGRKVPSALQQATTVTVSAFSAQATDETTFNPFTAKTSPGLVFSCNPPSTLGSTLKLSTTTFLDIAVHLANDKLSAFLTDIWILRKRRRS
ncbi:unnamed protein product [Acanthoscelides obtectus]|uniref:Uncharacterized protein n=1 Tax=Acanthoscelides obtectus TaxID=200917 RepID=A0A9P0P5C5_ACAOB|nr:unnamed protein product [Acanthoscelides obtectus]CAK1635038.1 hypothetical protein AOBTE_LOCUS9016 [Acanthoscelides obtectus]